MNDLHNIENFSTLGLTPQTASMPNPINIVLADDHHLFNDGMQMILNRQENFKVIGIAKDGEQLQVLLKEVNPHLILLDINMPGTDGIDLIPILKEQGYEGEIIMLSSSIDSRLVYDAARKGAKGYLSKKSARTEIIEAIDAVVNKGKNYFGKDINEQLLEDMVAGGHSKREWQEQEPAMLRQLTEREIEVLRFIAMEFTSKEIAEQLFIAQSTVDTHRKNLIQKLKVRNAIGLGKFALRNGLI